jgi:maleylacetate reductase
MHCPKWNDDVLMSSFAYEALPMRVRFGAGALSLLAGEVVRLGLRRVLVLCSPGQKAAGVLVAETLGALAADVLPVARTHVPVEIADLARARAAALGADGCVAVGGGSAIGLGKVVALEHNLPVIAVPTTYAGSEMTTIWGLTRGGVKRTGKDPRVLPASVVYDPELTLGLPVPISVTSALNAVAHAAEALYAPDSSPITALLAEEGIHALITSLPGIVADPGDLDARTRALYGSWLCGACLGATTMSLHHKICHVLGGALDLPHASTHAVLIPHVLAYNLSAAPAAVDALSRALTAADPVRKLWDLSRSWRAPRSLAELGMPESAIERIAEQVVDNPYANPAPVTLDGVAGLLRSAWAGDRPAAVPAQCSCPS